MNEPAFAGRQAAETVGLSKINDLESNHLVYFKQLPRMRNYLKLGQYLNY